MLFNSVEYFVFFSLVFAIYWSISKKVSGQNIFLLIVSYFFYACWDWRFLGLIIFSTLLNYSVAILIEKLEKHSKSLLIFGLIFNLGILFYYKYFNFFIESFLTLFSFFGSTNQFNTLEIILPIGISFYTFQSIAYLVDVYKKKVNSETNLITFSVFIAFFPQLVAGPIERAQNLLAQLKQKKIFEYKMASDGMKLILLGLFEKVVIADNCAAIVNTIYQDYENQSGSNLMLAAVYFSFQIYGDFSGYSHIAIGSAKLLGINLVNNFNYPYLAKNMADFWRRWHISFSNWLKEYIYYPLGGSKFGEFMMIRNLVIVFLLSGLWHGASVNFIIYGFIQAILYITLIYYRKYVKDKLQFLKSDFLLLSILGTFTALTIARVFFRAESFAQAKSYLSILFSESLFTIPTISKGLFLLLVLMMLAEYFQRNRSHLFDLSFIKSVNVRYAIYLVLIFIVFYFKGESQKFIYFQF